MDAGGRATFPSLVRQLSSADRKKLRDLYGGDNDAACDDMVRRGYLRRDDDNYCRPGAGVDVEKWRRT